MSVREPAVAGTFYPENEQKLTKMINGFLRTVPEQKIKGKLKALVVPHAGYIYSGQVAAYAYKLLESNKKKIAVLLGPSHHMHFNELGADTNREWKTPLGNVRSARQDFETMEGAHVHEHSLEVQLPFLQIVLDKFGILPLILGDVNPKDVSKQISYLLNDDTILIVSTDLSHYNDYETAKQLDSITINYIRDLDYDALNDEGNACGKDSLLVVVDLAKKLGWKCKLLKYMNSGDTAGDKDKVVGYVSMAFYEEE